MGTEVSSLGEVLLLKFYSKYKDPLEIVSNIEILWASPEH